MVNRCFEGVQDCKEFQGELFGICNLFRDLSDKLFTCEIIELHKKHGNETGNYHSEGQKITKHKGGIVSLKESAVTVSSLSENGVSIDSDKHTCKTVPEDLGIVHAHRNEDIVNKGAGVQGEADISISQIDNTSESCIPQRKRRKAYGKKNKSSIDERKTQYSLLAKSMGMKELEFSEWFLSATPLEREKVLHDYKKRKQRLPNG